MALSIRDPEAGRLARELAALRKSNMTEAIVHALRSELKRERGKRPLADRLAELAQILEAEAGPSPREVTKELIDAMWGQGCLLTFGDRSHPPGRKRRPRVVGADRGWNRAFDVIRGPA